MTTSSDLPKPHATKIGRYYYFNRGAAPDCPAGITVSKRDTLPEGDFRITEYIFQQFGYETLWFVDADRFTANERQAAYERKGKRSDV